MKSTENWVAASPCRARTLRLAAEAGEIEAVHPDVVYKLTKLMHDHKAELAANFGALSGSPSPSPSPSPAPARAITERARQNPKYPTGSHPDQHSDRTVKIIESGESLTLSTANPLGARDEIRKPVRMALIPLLENRKLASKIHQM